MTFTTIAPDQLSVVLEALDDTHALVFQSHGPLMAMPFAGLLTNLGGIARRLPPAAAVPYHNGDLNIVRASNTKITFKLRGLDGVVRVASLDLAEPGVETLNFTYAEVRNGWTLLSDAAISPDKHFVATSATQSFAATWAGVIDGKSAYVKMADDYAGTPAADALRISVDGAPYHLSGAPNGDGEYTLFENLANGPHFVTFQADTGNISREWLWMPKTGNVMRVVGNTPAVMPAGEWTMIGDASTKTVKPNGLIPSQAGNTYGADRLPAFVAAQDIGAFNGAGRTGVQGLIALRTQATELWVVTQARFIYLYDGETLTEYDTTADLTIGANAIRVKRITGLAGLKTYYVWMGVRQTVPVGAWLAVGVPSGQQIGQLSGVNKAHLYGDSITEGISGGASESFVNTEQTSGHVELLRSFAKKNYAVGNFAVAGQDGAGLDAALPNYLARLTVTASDVAFVAIGHNGAIQASEITAIAAKLLAKGYGKVLFRGVLPYTGNGQLPKNVIISGAVAALNNPAVRYIDPNAWGALVTNTALKWDGVHPNPAGYEYLEPLMDAALTTALA